MTVAAELSIDLINFLGKNDYSHIFCSGILDPKPDSIETEDYILIPLKATDPRLKNTIEVEKCISINSSDVEDMALGTSGIRFIIQIPQNLYYNFLTASTI